MFKPRIFRREYQPPRWSSIRFSTNHIKLEQTVPAFHQTVLSFPGNKQSEEKSNSQKIPKKKKKKRLRPSR